MESKIDQLAVLIDADNVSHNRIGKILEEIAGLGNAIVKRIYGDFTGRKVPWKDLMNKFAIHPMQQFSYTSGKNSSDIALVLDAMDLLHTDRFDGFCLVTSDSDFTGLAMRIREQGLKVYGFGESKTPEAFRNACDKFTQIELLQISDDLIQQSGKTSDVPQTVTPLPEIVVMLDKAIVATGGDENAILLSQVGATLRRQNPSFDPRTYGHIKLQDILKDYPEHYKLRGTAGTLTVEFVHKQ